MPETDVIPTSASVASTGPGIRYIGDHCYAMSGAITSTGSATGADTSYLNFVTGTGYIVAKIIWINDKLAVLPIILFRLILMIYQYSRGDANRRRL